MDDDDALLAAFEACTLERFGHAEHVRVAFAILARERDFAAAALRFRAGLARFAASAPGKLHETLTWAYLALIHERMHADPDHDSRRWLARHPELLDHSALARAYGDLDELRASPLARAVFVLPRTR